MIWSCGLVPTLRAGGGTSVIKAPSVSLNVGLPTSLWIGFGALAVLAGVIAWWSLARIDARRSDGPSVPRPDRALERTGAPAPPDPDRGRPERSPGRTGCVPPSEPFAAAGLVEPARPAPAHGEGDRRRLVMLCIDVADRLRTENPALHNRLNRGLAEVGVTVLVPDGEPFDRRRHDAVAVEPSPTPERDRTVANTELLGYLDRGGLLRRPEVIVYSAEGASGER